MKPRTPRKVIQEVSAKSGEVDSRQIVAQANHPTLLLNAPGAYGAPGTPPVLPRENAMGTAKALANARYVQVSGNHLTDNPWRKRNKSGRGNNTLCWGLRSRRTSCTAAILH